jgi:hypothetical protein
MKGNCRGCDFWVPTHWRDTSGDGTCHRNAPKVFKNPRAYELFKTAWPITLAGEGCGDFEPFVEAET